MGFNRSAPSDHPIHRTAFNPLACGHAPRCLGSASPAGEPGRKTFQPSHRDAFFELIGYPVLAATAQNNKFLYTGRSFLDATHRDTKQALIDGVRVHHAYDDT